MKLNNKIGNLVEIDWANDLHELQPDNVKVPVNLNYLKESIVEHGFALPFTVWNNNGKYYCIDGHTRKQVLTELVAEGVEVPKKLKAFEILVKDRTEAIKILVEVYNQKHNPFAEEILTEWLEAEEIEVEDLSLESVNVIQDDKKQIEANSEEEVDLSKFSQSAESYLNNNLRQIVLIYDNELHKKTLEDLAEIGADFDIEDDNSSIVLKLIEFYKENH